MGDQLSKMKSLNESLVKEVKNLKQGNISKCKKDEEIYRWINHNQTLLGEVNRLKEKKKHYQHQEKPKILDDETTKILEVEICKKVEEIVNTDEVKLEMESRIEEGCKKLMDGITLQLQKEK